MGIHICDVQNNLIQWTTMFCLTQLHVQKNLSITSLTTIVIFVHYENLVINMAIVLQNNINVILFHKKIIVIIY
jgi:hypothetical protein